MMISSSRILAETCLDQSLLQLCGHAVVFSGLDARCGIHVIIHASRMPTDLSRARGVCFLDSMAAAGRGPPMTSLSN